MCKIWQQFPDTALQVEKAGHRHRKTLTLLSYKKLILTPKWALWAQHYFAFVLYFGSCVSVFYV